MIGRMILCFAFLCVLVRSNETEKLYKQNHIKFQATENEKVSYSSPVKSNDPRSKEMKIIKRGIVLVDEDFDVPSAIYAHENNSGTNVNLSPDIFGRTEGSGNDVLVEKELNTTTKQMILPHAAKESSASTQLTKGDEKMMATKDITSSTDFESSGDDRMTATKEYSVTEMTSQTKLAHDFYNEMPDICMNSTCSQDDLSLSSSERTSLMAEDTNLTLSCKSNNFDHSMLYWYKSNGTIYFLQAFGTDKELLLNIPDTKPVHSGMYKCVKSVNRQTCCNLKINLTVYEKPFYRYYLIILGLIAAGGLIICIFLTVRQTITLKTYTKQFVEKHGKDKQLLL